jgi:hypothetical protein
MVKTVMRYKFNNNSNNNTIASLSKFKYCKNLFNRGLNTLFIRSWRLCGSDSRSYPHGSILSKLHSGPPSVKPGLMCGLYSMKSKQFHQVCSNIIIPISTTNHCTSVRILLRVLATATTTKMQYARVHCCTSSRTI